jgi:hypothetical protein
MLHHNNASCHTAVYINQSLADKSIPVVPHSPCLPDLSPCDLFVFPCLKSHLNGPHFGMFYNIQMSVIIDELEGIPA